MTTRVYRRLKIGLLSDSSPDSKIAVSHSLVWRHPSRAVASTALAFESGLQVQVSQTTKTDYTCEGLSSEGQPMEVIKCLKDVKPNFEVDEVRNSAM